MRTRTIINLSVAAVDSTDAGPSEYGFMRQHGFHAPDCRHWELVRLISESGIQP